MKTLSSILLAWVVVSVASAAQAATYPRPVEGDGILTNFAFASGETLPQLRLHYRTLGEPRRNEAGLVTNAVLALHGTTGSGASLLADSFAEVLFGTNGLLDARRYFIVLPDGIGHGKSSKPSDGLRMKFPRYDYDDMVRAQHGLLTECLGVNHLRLVIGTSMGGMHAWVWGCTYPGFMDALMPLASAPVEVAGRNRFWRKLIMDAIRDDPAWDGGKYTNQPPAMQTVGAIMLLMGPGPIQLHQLAPTREEADRILPEQLARRIRGADANDVLYAFDASRNYNPAPHLGSIQAALVAVNFGDDPINPPELGVVEREIGKVPRGRFVLIPPGPTTRGHGTHTFAEVWQEHLRALLAAPAQPR